MQKIFKRHDKDKDGFLSKEGEIAIGLVKLPLLPHFLITMIFRLLEFTMLMRNYKDDNLSQKDIETIFEGMLPNSEAKGVDLKSFIKHSL